MRQMSSSLFTPSLFSTPVIASPHITEPKKRCRQKKISFWRKVWDGFWSHDPWPYTPVVFYTEQVPAMMYDATRNVIYCHPALEEKLKAVNAGYKT